MSSGPNRWAAVLAAVVAALVAARPASAVELSLEEALAGAVSQNPDVRRARAARGAVESRRVGAGVVMPSNPVLSGSVGSLRVSSQTVAGTTYPGGSGLQWSARLEQSVEVGGQRGARLNEVDRAVDAARQRELQALVEAEAAVRAAYAGAWIAQERLAGEQSRELLGRQLVESVRLRVTGGAASGVDLALAETEHGRIQAGRIGAEIDVEVQLAALRTLVGLPAEEPVRLTSSLGDPGTAEIPSYATLLDLALGRRADVAALRAALAELEAVGARLEREVVPTPTLFVDVVGQPEAGGQPGQLYAGGGVALPLPTWRRNQGELATVRAERARIEAELSLLERQIAEEVTRARGQLVRRRAEADLYARAVLPAAERVVQLTADGYRSGKFDLFRVIAAAHEAGDARREHLTAVGALWQARIALDRAIGGIGTRQSAGAAATPSTPPTRRSDNE